MIAKEGRDGNEARRFIGRSYDTKIKVSLVLSSYHSDFLCHFPFSPNLFFK